MYTTLITADQLLALPPEDLIIIDCRFDLSDTEAGRRAYAEGHLPGATYAHLDDDLSGPVLPGKTGRHPLPCVTAAATLFGRMGVHKGRQVVVYDDKNGAIAARAWWMLRWLGHETVAVLDGGWRAWLAASGPVTREVPERRPVEFIPHPHEDWTITADQVEELRRADDGSLVDSRAPERYRGEVEPIDPIAGHIPGAINLPFTENWDENGRMRTSEELRRRFAALPPAEHAIFYCGSGVTACHNILAYAHAGLGMARLYPGSWSEWIAEPRRDVAKG